MHKQLVAMSGQLVAVEGQARALDTDCIKLVSQPEQLLSATINLAMEVKLCVIIHVDSNLEQLCD